jgi:hypothetical protein
MAIAAAICTSPLSARLLLFTPPHDDETTMSRVEGVVKLTVGMDGQRILKLYRKKTMDEAQNPVLARFLDAHQKGWGRNKVYILRLKCG